MVARKKILILSISTALLVVLIIFMFILVKNNQNNNEFVSIDNASLGFEVTQGTSLYELYSLMGTAFTNEINTKYNLIDNTDRFKNYTDTSNKAIYESEEGNFALIIDKITNSIIEVAIGSELLGNIHIGEAKLRPEKLSPINKPYTDYNFANQNIFERVYHELGLSVVYYGPQQLQFISGINIFEPQSKEEFEQNIGTGKQSSLLRYYYGPDYINPTN